jgi:uncharacterized ferritin-like protein (DUF455 family)
MEVVDFALHILKSEDLENKFFFPESIEFNAVHEETLFFDQPYRSKKIKLADKQIRFPRGHFHLDEKKAMALHSFANHELLAIEMMAQALLVYPHNTLELQRFKRGLLKSLKDEQKHCLMYIKRLNEIGYEFGDFPLNDFFWKYMGQLKTPDQFLSVMALTFEAANLDFAKYYHDIFKKIEDYKTANILKVVLEDEISHVNLGVHYLNLWRKDKTLWEYYLSQLPLQLTPARSKGQFFEKDLRFQASMDPDFVFQLENYEDDFSITKRKTWKSNE